MFDLDEAMADVVVRASQPALAAIKLAWWRERLEELDEGKVPAEPRLQQAAEQLLSRGISGRELAGLEDGWAAVLEETPDRKRVIDRGAILFRLAERLIGADDDRETIEAAGRIYACADAARRGLLKLGSDDVDRDPVRVPRPTRPLTALAALASRDLREGGPPFECEASPARAWTLLRHRLTGR